MKANPVRLLIFAGALALTAIFGAGASRAEDSHMYCPAGSGLVCWIFGCWCEDSGLNRVHSVDCAALPPQQPWTWNAYVDVGQACAQKPAAQGQNQPKATSP